MTKICYEKDDQRTFPKSQPSCDFKENHVEAIVAYIVLTF